jgi:hypothetical protein
LHERFCLMATSLEKTMLVAYQIWLVRMNAGKEKTEGKKEMMGNAIRQKGGSTSEALEEGGSIYLSRGWVKALSVEAEI